MQVPAPEVKIELEEQKKKQFKTGNIKDILLASLYFFRFSIPLVKYTDTVHKQSFRTYYFFRYLLPLGSGPAKIRIRNLRMRIRNTK